MAFLDETGLAEVWSLANGKFGRVAFGTYVGTGSVGSANPNTLAFDFEPKFVLITTYGRSDTYASTDYSYEKTTKDYMILTKYRAVSYNYNTTNALGYNVKVKFSGNSVSWYADASNAACQANSGGGTSGGTYQSIYGYVAIG